MELSERHDPRSRRARSVLRRLWAATWKIALFVVLWSGLYAPAILIGSATGRLTAPLGPASRLYFESAGAVAVLLAAWAMVRFADRRSFRSLGFDRRTAGGELGFGVLLGAVLVGGTLLILWLPGWLEWRSAASISGQMLALLALVMLVNSVTQEVLVRGYVFQAVEAESNSSVALAVSSLLFTALHGGAIAEAGVVSAINLFAAGWLLGTAYVVTRQLWLPIGLHFSWNFIQGPLLGIAVSGQALDGGWKLIELDGPALFTGGAFGLEGGLAVTATTALGIVVLRFRYRSEKSLS